MLSPRISRSLLFLLVLFWCADFGSSLKAQQKECLPVVALPAPAEPNIFTEEQEIILGEAIAEYIQKDYKIFEDAALTEYLAKMGRRLGEHLPLTRMRLQFFLVDLPDANAFILPGGRIYVSRKLVALARNEDELAGIIAHELGHLAAREGAITSTRLFKEVLGVTAVTDRRDIFEKYNQLIDNVARKPGAFKSGDREKGQMVADQIGFYALVKAGYDATALARFWDRMTETKGKTGGFFSDLFGTTRPEERRLREMLKAVEKLPASCFEAPTATTAARQEDFQKWQASVVSYSGLGRRESLQGLLLKQQLTPPLRSDITHLRFSPDGNYVLAQDDAGINVLARTPFAPLFRIEALDAKLAGFSPDSQRIVFYTDNLRVESWGVAEQKMLTAKEVVVRKGCWQTALSPDGKYLACLNSDFALTMLDVETGQMALQKKDFFVLDFYNYLRLLGAINSGVDNTDVGIDLIHMGFSPDGRYFLAGYTSGSRGNVAEAFDLVALSKISLPDSLKKFIAGGFVFIGNDRLAAINRENFKKSGLVAFPSGQMLSEMELWREGMTAATRGPYLLIRPIKDYALGVMDLNTRTIIKVNEQPALDIYGDLLVAEMRNGQVGLYRMEKNELLGTTLLTNSTLGRLHVAEFSDDMKWLALSTRTRGGVWNLQTGEAALYLRGFRGGHFDGRGHFFADFPKYDEAERNIARFTLATGEVKPGEKIESATALQAGQYLAVTKSAKENANEYQAALLGRNIIFELLDARTMKSLWSKTYPKAAPRIWIAAHYESIALAWDVKDDAAKTEIGKSPVLTRQLAAMKEKEGDYLLQILDARNGNMLGQLLIETGKGSFRLSNVYATGDWVIVTDTQNRVLVYSLSSGELKGRAFGGSVTVAQSTGLLCVENESGQLTVYDLKTMEKARQYTFSNPVSLARFSEDGQRLLVLTSNQTFHVLDVSDVKLSPAAKSETATTP